MSLSEREVANSIYSFCYRGELAEEALERVVDKNHHRSDDLARLRKALSTRLLDQEKVAASERMAVVYVAISAFEGSVRDLVEQVLLEDIGEGWWGQCVSDRIRKSSESRRDEELKRKFHTQRGGRLLDYTDMGNLSSIIVTNWEKFEEIVGADLEWVKHILKSLESSRNVIMHGGYLDINDVQRVGMLVRDWVKQVGV